MKQYVIESDGKKRPGESHVCENPDCKKSFMRRANGKYKKRFCSNSCSSIMQKDRVTVSCYNCGKKVEKTKSGMNLSRHNVHFCSRKCKEKSQSLTGNCQLIRPTHYGNGLKNTVYSSLIDRTLNPKCSGCGEKRRYLLSVHHIDKNRENNPLDGSNWEIVCYNCHAKRHLRKNGVKWEFSYSYLTPREELKNL